MRKEGPQGARRCEREERREAVVEALASLRLAVQRKQSGGEERRC